MFGDNAWLWCWPGRTAGDGVAYEVSIDDGEWHSMPKGEPQGLHQWELPSHEGRPWYAFFTSSPSSQLNVCRKAHRFRLSAISSYWHTELISTYFTDLEEPKSWPPRDPTEEHAFQLPESPWTYENGSLNPNLRSSGGSARQRRTRLTKHAVEGAASSVPPYHPDYGRNTRDEEHSIDGSTADSVSDDNYDADPRTLPRIRRDSEGYTVRNVDREAMLAQYIEDMTAQEGRYERYVPEPMSESSEEEDEPLRAGGATSVSSSF